MSDHTGTGEGLIAFLDYTADKGLMNAGTAKAYRAAVREVLGAVEEDWFSADVTTIDVDDVLRRFEVKSGMKYTPKSLTTYKSRFRNALTIYAEFRQNPSGWRPARSVPTRERAPTTSVARESARGRAYQDTIARVVAEQHSYGRDDARPTETDGGRPTAMQTYPFPLRRDDGVIFVTLTLPADLTLKEVERISAHLRTLAIPEPLAISARPKPDESQGDN
jgi:hypothetical protein